MEEFLLNCYEQAKNGEWTEKPNALQEELFKKSIPAMNLYLDEKHIVPLSLVWDEELSLYFIPCAIKGGVDIDGHIMLKPDHLILNFTNKYDFNGHSADLNTSISSYGENVSGVITDLINPETPVITEFSNDGIILNNEIIPFKAEDGKGKMQEAINAQKIAYNSADKIVNRVIPKTI